MGGQNTQEPRRKQADRVSLRAGFERGWKERTSERADRRRRQFKRSSWWWVVALIAVGNQAIQEIAMGPGAHRAIRHKATDGSGSDMP